MDVKVMFVVQSNPDRSHWRCNPQKEREDDAIAAKSVCLLLKYELQERRMTHGKEI